MKFHTPSFLMGFASATVLAMTGKRLKPIAVELGALGLHLGHLGWGVIERQREYVEDVWAEMEERARDRKRRSSAERGAQQPQTIRVETAPHNGSHARH